MIYFHALFQRLPHPFLFFMCLSSNLFLSFFLFYSLSGSVGVPYLIFPDVDTDSAINTAHTAREEEGENERDDYVNGRREGDLLFPLSNSTSLTQGPLTIGNAQISVLDYTVSTLLKTAIFFIHTTIHLLSLTFITSSRRSFTLPWYQSILSYPSFYLPVIIILFSSTQLNG